jgi:hypothetical protein
MAPDAWRDLTADEVSPNGRRRIDWFHIPAADMDDQTRWRVLLACTARVLDLQKFLRLGQV